MATKLRRDALRIEFGRWSYISRPSWTVLASILEGLGVDFARLGLHRGSNLASKIAPIAALERPRAVQDSPRAAEECPRGPRTAQEPPKSFPKVDQDGQELPRTRPGLVQDLPRSAPEPTHYPRLEKNSQLHPAILQNFLPCHKAANFKNERRRYSPQGGLQFAAQSGSACEMGTRGLLLTFPHPSWTKFLTQRFSDLDSFLPPPKSSPLGSGRLHLLRRSAALARLGASWAEKIAFQEAFKN